jgi:hypothetical protein
MYYTFVPSVNRKKIGFYPQALLDGESFKYIDNSTKEYISFKDLNNKQPNITIQVNDKAVLTDVLDRTSLSFGIIINEKVKGLIGAFTLPPHQLYPITVIYRNEKFVYYWFHFYNDLFEYLDMAKSTVEIVHKFDFYSIDTRLLLSEENFNELKNALTFDQIIRVKEFFLKDNFPQYDIFLNNVYGYATLLSQKAVDVFNENRITGCDIAAYAYLQ